MHQTFRVILKRFIVRFDMVVNCYEFETRIHAKRKNETGENNTSISFWMFICDKGGPRYRRDNKQQDEFFVHHATVKFHTEKAQPTVL